MAPEGIVLIAVLCAALMHATWNAILKSAGDRLISLAAQDCVMFTLGCMLLLIAPFPAPEAWPFIAASSGVHIFYRAFLLKAYRYGDLSRVYPVARGSAPLWVAMAGLAIGDDVLTIAGFMSVSLIALGIISLIFSRAYGGMTLGRAKWDRGLTYAFATGVVIAIYSVIDSRGVRLSDSVLGYIGLLFATECIPVPAFVLATRRKDLVKTMRANGFGGVYGGVFAVTGYGLVIWAFTQASAAQVVALRETSVIFGAIIGAYILKEGFGPRRVFSAGLVALGVILLRMTG